MKLEEEKIIAGMKAAFEVIEANLPQHNLLASLTDRANLAVPHERTCSVGQDYLVFIQHGQVAKCQMKMHESITDVHADDSLQLIRADQVGVQNISVDEKEGCRDCEWKNWCAGAALWKRTGLPGAMMSNPPIAIFTKTSSPKYCDLKACACSNMRAN